MYDGTNWVVMGDPVIENYFGTDFGYEKKANGLLIQWTNNLAQDHDFTWEFQIAFSNTDYIVSGGFWIEDFAAVNISKYTTKCVYSCEEKHVSTRFFLALGY